MRRWGFIFRGRGERTLTGEVEAIVLRSGGEGEQMGFNQRSLA